MTAASRPFPLPGDIKTPRPVVCLVRAACAHLRAFIGGCGSTPESAARAMFGSGDVVTAEILRSAATPATTTTNNWAQQIASIAIYDLIQSVTSQSAAAAVIDRALQLNMDSIAELRIPGRTLSSSAAGTWVQEGQPAPVRALS